MLITMFLAAAVSGAAADSDLDALIQQLDADRYSARQKASNRLSAMGTSAFDALEQAALGDSREARSRAMEILAEHFRNGEDSVKRAAEAKLQKIAETESVAAGLAREVLQPPQSNMAKQQQMRAQAIQIALANRAMGQRIIVPQIRPAAPAIPVVPFPPANRAIRNRRIQVQGGGRSIKIEIDNGKIKMEVEETIDGKKQNIKIEAKDEEELKKKWPKEYKYYQQYAAGKPAAPAGPFGPQIRPEQRLLDSIKRSEQRLDREVEQLKKQLQGEPLQRALQTLERRRQMYQQMRKRYEDRLKNR